MRLETCFLGVIITIAIGFISSPLLARVGSENCMNNGVFVPNTVCNDPGTWVPNAGGGNGLCGTCTDLIYTWPGGECGPLGEPLPEGHVAYCEECYAYVPAVITYAYVARVPTSEQKAACLLAKNAQIELETATCDTLFGENSAGSAACRALAVTAAECIYESCLYHPCIVSDPVNSGTVDTCY